MTFEELKQEFIDNGFQIDGDTFFQERVEYSTITINGQVHQQPHTSRFEMKYVGLGSISNVGDSDSDVEEIPFYEFDVMNGRDLLFTLCIESFDDFVKLVNL